jgi:pyruvate/2-oxoglutarate dehydrogenase complex dihydrolipoamide acyltransferase (E2) component
MAHTFVMPKLGHLMEEATVLCWERHAGESVEKGDVLLQIETVKSILEVESDYSGVVLRILVAEGEQVEVGTPLALLGGPEDET